MHVTAVEDHMLYIGLKSLFCQNRMFMRLNDKSTCLLLEPSTTWQGSGSGLFSGTTDFLAIKFNFWPMALKYCTSSYLILTQWQFSLWSDCAICHLCNMWRTWLYCCMQLYLCFCILNFLITYFVFLFLFTLALGTGGDTRCINVCVMLKNWKI